MRLALCGPRFAVYQPKTAGVPAMIKLSDQIQEMQRRLTSSALDDQAFVKALGEALSDVDQHLLKEVRRLGDEHEARRGAILRELQDLAGRLCLLPVRTAKATAIDHRELEAQLNRLPPIDRHAYTNPPIDALAPGDWRKATSAIDDDLDTYWRAPGASH